MVELLLAVGVAAALIALAGIGYARLVQRAKGVQCISNLRSMGSAALLFAADHNQRLPIAKDWGFDRSEAYWWSQLNPYLDSSADPTLMGPLHRCPCGEAVKVFGKRLVSNKWTATDYTPVLSYPGGYYHYFNKIRPELTPFLVEAENYGGSLGIVNSNVPSLIPERARKRHGADGIYVLYCSGSVQFVPEPTWEKIRPQYNNEANLAK